MKIKDLGLITAIKVKGQKELEMDQSDPRQVYFVFDDIEELKKLIDSYYADNLMVSALEFMEMYKRVKRKLYYIKDRLVPYK